MARARFRYENRDSPDYQSNYGTTFTERQLDILGGKIPLEKVRLNELTLIRRKAQQLGDSERDELAALLIEEKTRPPDEYEPPYTEEEAKEVLQRLTPWKIDWDKY